MSQKDLVNLTWIEKLVKRAAISMFFVMIVLSVGISEHITPNYFLCFVFSCLLTMLLSSIYLNLYKISKKKSAMFSLAANSVTITVPLTFLLFGMEIIGMIEPLGNWQIILFLLFGCSLIALLGQWVKESIAPPSDINTIKIEV